MKQWKINQEIYHRLNKDYDDDLSDKIIIITDNIVDNAVRYFKTTDIGWIYPSKSYMVAICYARWLREYFNEDSIECLNDPDLLYNNDPYFTTYDKMKNTYDSILSKIGGWNFDETQGMVPDVKRYFLDEFLL